MTLPTMPMEGNIIFIFSSFDKGFGVPAPAPDIFMASMSTDDTWPEILSVITVMSHLVGNCLDLTKPNSSLASMNVPCELDICFIETFLCICSFMLPVIGGPKVQRLKVVFYQWFCGGASRGEDAVPFISR